MTIDFPNPSGRVGKVQLFLESMPETDDCIIWPFYINAITGYGKLTRGGVDYLAHRFVCECANGPQPIGKPHASHNCGIKGCVNYKHLEWKSVPDNSKDRIIHGTMLTGESVYNSVFTQEQARYFRKSGRSAASLSKEFGHYHTIWKILAGQSYIEEIAA